MSLLASLKIDNTSKFNSALGHIIKTSEYAGKEVNLPQFLYEGSNKGYTIYPTNQAKLDAMEAKAQAPEVEEQSKSFDLMLAEYYIMKHAQCITRGIAFDLSLADLRKLYKKKTCYYTGERVELPPMLNSRNAWTLDRKDNKVGYKKDNVVVCAKWVNQLKNELLENPSSSFKTDLKTLIKIVNKLGE